METEQREHKVSTCNQTVMEARIDYIRQKLFYYDNVPPDEYIVSFVMEWRDLAKRLYGDGLRKMPY